jgi:putative hydrolase of the HAD superfamily
LDGVLIPSTPSFEYFEVEYNITPANFGEFFHGPYDSAMLGEVDLFDILPSALERWKWKGTVEEFALAWFRSCAEPDPEALESVRALQHHGVTRYVATNQDTRRAEFLDSQVWLQTLFDRRFYSCRMGVKKPHAEYFNVIQREAVLLPQDMLFVDDKMENVEGARRCGWCAEVCRSASDLRAVMAKYFPELASIREAWSGAS